MQVFSGTGGAAARKAPPRRPSRPPGPVSLLAYRAPVSRPHAPSRPLRAVQAARPTRPGKAAPAGPVSPYLNPFRGAPGVTGSRIDQGVDYTGKAGQPIYAPAAGRVVSAQAAGSGWPGGGFVAEQLTSGPAKGHVIYFAEDVQPASGVHVGQAVTPKTILARFNQSGWIEAGWGTERGNVGNAIASGPAYGQGTEAAAGGDPGRYTTGWGAAFNKLMHSLGAPSGTYNYPVSGGAPSWASARGGAPSSPAAALPPQAPPGPGNPARVLPVRSSLPSPRPGVSGGSPRVTGIRRGRGVTGPASHPPVKALGGILTPSPAPQVTPVPTSGTTDGTSPASGLTSLFTGASSSSPAAAAAGPATGRYDWLLVLAVIGVIGFLGAKGLKK